jgi:hypothetical protein
MMTRMHPEVFICGPGARVDTAKKEIIGESIKLPMNGAMAKLEQVASGAGLRTVSGIIKFKPVGGGESREVFKRNMKWQHRIWWSARPR